MRRERRRQGCRGRGVLGCRRASCSHRHARSRPAARRRRPSPATRPRSSPGRSSRTHRILIGYARPECKPAGGAAWEPIKDVWGIHLTGVRGVNGATGRPAMVVRVLEVVVAREPMRYRGLIAAGQPRQHPPRVRGHPPSLACPSAGRPRRARRRATPVTWIPQKDVMHSSRPGREPRRQTVPGMAGCRSRAARM